MLARIPLLPALPGGNAAVAGDPVLAEGIFLASRQAGTAADRGGPLPDPGGRLAATLRGYEIRARFRPTPNGVFAGACRASIGHEAASLSLGAGHRARTIPAAGWLATVSARVMDDPAALPLLTFTASNLITRRGQRLETERQAVPGEAGPQQVSVRATDATTLIMEVCRAGAALSDIHQAVTRQWPSVPESVISATVLSLARAGFLLTDLLPEDLSRDPVGHLLERVPGPSPLREPLSRVRCLLQEADQYPPGRPARLAAVSAARDLADSISLQDRPLAVDVAADARISIPAALAGEAADAAGVLWQTGPSRDPLTGYHDRFLARYGPRRFVPLLEAADPAAGLGTDIGQCADGDPSRSARRSSVLAALLARAATQGATEVVLGPAAVAALASAQPAGSPPRTAEIYVRVLAASQQDLAAGRLFLAVCPAAGSQDAGSTAGRLAGLLPGGWPARDTCPSALVAELVIRPRAPQAAVLSPPAGLAAWRIPVGVPPEDGDIEPGDLLLASDGSQLITWSASRDQQVIPVLYSRLAPYLIPPLAQFLQLLGHAGSRPWHDWSWDPFGHGPFQPRVRYGRTVLAPARWPLPAGLTRAARSWSAWESALDAWRAAPDPQPPDIVVTEDGDRRLPLDLRQQNDRELLRRYVRRGVSAVTEQPGGPGAVQAVVAGPAGHHLLELVVPLTRRAAVPAPARPAPIPGRGAGQGLHLPGGEWLSLAIRSPARCHDEILPGLAAVASELAGQWDRWFWLRYHDDAHGPHVRARFHGHPAVLGGQVLPAVSAWCSGLVSQQLSGGLTVEPYDQEIERYGGPGSISAAERVFAADSRAALAVITATADPGHRIVMAALAAADIVRVVAGGDPAALPGRQLDRSGRRRMEALRPAARAADRAASAWPVPLASQPGWAARREALAAYRDILAPEQRLPCASSLVHMHANRLLGHADRERLACALAADLLARPS